MATAGLRMVESETRERILESCRRVLRASGFRFRDDWATVIPGKWFRFFIFFSYFGGIPLICSCEKSKLLFSSRVRQDLVPIFQMACCFDMLRRWVFQDLQDFLFSKLEGLVLPGNLIGTDEGSYAWVAANYALGTLGGDPQETTGIIELGGASAQVIDPFSFLDIISPACVNVLPSAQI